MHWFAEHAPKSLKYQIIKFGRLNATNFSEVAKIILKLHFFTRVRVLRKNKEDYQTKKNCDNVLYLILGATGWQNTPENLLNINLPNLSADCKRPSGRSKNYFVVTLSNSKASFKKKPMRNIKQKNCENALYLILGALVGRAHPKIR